ncbi:outer membrane lipoprotein carrier protein LolA [Kitasatospora sp. NPDC101183]|uniref:LolA family protein n=1 Tax=Kitasatospora sp. NPDC101183 TaxID=3364100 RepID=UPI00382A2EB5
MTNDTAAVHGVDGGDGAPYRSRRRTLVRAAVPLAIAATIAAGVGLVPALAADSPPDLPSLTAEQLVAKVLGSDAQSVSGTVKVSTDLGLPSGLLGAAGGLGAASGHGSGKAGADPQANVLGLLGGDQTLRVAVDGPDHQRVDLLKDMAGYTLVHNGDQTWAWDSATNTAVHRTGKPAAEHAKAPLTGVPSTPQEAAKQFLAAGAGTTSVTVTGTTTVAGQNAYKLSVKPTQSGSTIYEVRISVAAENGVPLAVQVRGVDGSTVLDVHFTDVSFAKPDAKTFDFTAPKGATVTEGKAKGEHAQGATGLPGVGKAEDLNVIGEGWTTVLTGKVPDAPAPSASSKDGKHHGPTINPQGLIKSLGKPVKGGTLISTKVLNVLLTDDGRVFAGAVTQSVLEHAAGVN